MIQARNNPNALPLLILVAAVVFVLVIVPVMMDVSQTLTSISDPGQATTLDLQKYAMAVNGTQVLVRTSHASIKHGADARKCFEDPNHVLFLQEAISGRVHVVCSVTKTDFYDLIVRDRRADSGFIEEVTVFKVDAYPTVDDFVDVLLKRQNFPVSFIEQPSWMPTPINFIFGP